MLRAKSPQTKNSVHPQRVSMAAKKNAESVSNKLNQLLFKRMRYTFQVLKQFYLFSEGSSSSVMSISKYDKLIFNDQKIHTLFKKLQTKVLQRKIWGFLNIKMIQILKKASKMSKKMSKVVTQKKVEFISFSFERIKYVSINYSPKKKLRNQGSQTRIPSQSFISSSQKTVISITEELSYKMQPRVYVHRGSRSRSRSISPNSSFTRVLRQQQIKVYPKEVLGNLANIRRVSPQVTVTKITERSPAKNFYEVDQVKREYRNCYRMAPTRIRVVSCGCQNLLEKSCKCTALVDRICGCLTCKHYCGGCVKCNCCHSHCSCMNESNRSCSKQKKSIKFIKSPSKKNIEEKPSQNRNNYMNHLQNVSPRSQVTRFQHSNTRVTQIKR